MDTRLTYLLTLLPELPHLGETLPLSLADALVLLRQQGGADLEVLAGLLEAESPLRESLDEWVVNLPGSRSAPGALPRSVRALFDEGVLAGMTEEAWVDSVWQAYLDMFTEAGRRLGCGLLSRWSSWEGALRQNLARRRAGARGDRDESSAGPPPGTDAGVEAVLAAWSAAQSRETDAAPVVAALEAEVSLDRARLAYLEREAPRYSFSLDELAAYLLRLRLLERHQRLDSRQGRALLEEAVAL